MTSYSKTVCLLGNNDCVLVFFGSKWHYFWNVPKKDFTGQEQVQLTMHVPEEKVRLANMTKPKFHLNWVFAIFQNFQPNLA